MMTAAPRHFAIVLVSLVVLSGCARTVNLPQWQQSVQRYVENHGGGDPIVLQDVTLDRWRRGFTIYSDQHPERSTDARGLLLAHRPVAGEPRFIYLVGIVKKQRVRDIRLAALTVTDGQYQWRISPDDDHALAQYRQYNDRLWRQRFPQRQRPPLEYLGFPRDEDLFDLDVQGNTIIAKHAASGAQWELTIPPSPAPDRAAASALPRTAAR